MSFREDERKKITEIGDAVFRDPGGGVYSKLEREFALKDPMLNAWDGIREVISTALSGTRLSGGSGKINPLGTCSHRR